MTTYNTYQEAKIAMTKACIIEDTDSGLFFGMPTREGTTLAGGSRFAEPQYYCMTVEKFLKDNCKFDDGDTYLDWKGRVRIVGKVGFAKDACNDIRNIVNADQAFILRAAALEEKKPRTKVEYVKVTESIFDLRDEFERGELHYDFGDEDWFTFNDEDSLVAGFKEGNVYRRIETTMTEREAFIEAASKALPSFDKKTAPIWAGKLYDSGMFKLVK